MTGWPPQVAILMATFNGAEFLPQQLDSIAAQTHENWRLWVSDDGSADATLDILRRYQQAWSPDKLGLLAGPRRGRHSANFLSLAAQPDISADYYAWSDQDDVWLPLKLSRALERLAPLKAELPALYCSRTIWIDQEDRDIGLSPLMNNHPPSFANALVQCLAGGHTMVFNQAARSLIIACPDRSVASHDWWTYQLVTGSGGRVFYDPEPMVKYRQHKANISGKNRGLAARSSRFKRLLAGALKEYIGLSLEALKGQASSLTPENRAKLQILADLHAQSNPIKRLRLFQEGGFHRQHRAEQMALVLAAFLGRI